MNISKATIRIPIEAYSYVEFEVGQENGRIEAEDVVKIHNNVIKHLKGEDNIGLSDKDFNAWLDSYLTTGKDLSSDAYVRMNKDQQFVIQHIKRALKRIKNRSGLKDEEVKEEDQTLFSHIQKDEDDLFDDDDLEHYTGEEIKQNNIKNL